MRLALFLALFLPSVANAMPQAVVAVVAAFGGTISLATAGTIIFVGQILLTVALSVYGSAQQRRAARKAAEQARNEFNAGLQDRTITSITTEAAHRYIYGRARVGSTIVAMFTSGARDEFKHLICIHAAHECDGFEAMYLNGKKVAVLDGNGFPTSGDFTTSETLRAGSVIGGEQHTGPAFTLDHTPISGSLTIRTVILFTPAAAPNLAFTLVGRDVTITHGYAGPVYASYQYTVVTPRLRVRMHLGVPGDPADAALMAELPDKWKATATLNGLCYSYLRLDLNLPEFQTGIPSVEVLMRGKKLFDPRDASTAWSQNNALVIYDYLTSEMCGVPAADLPSAYFVTAANVCDEAQSFGNRYTFNGTVDADQDQKKILELMAQSMAGSIVSTTWEITAGKYVAPVAALDQSDIVGALAVNPGVSDADIFNGVRGQFISPENLYVPTDFTPFQNVAYVAADGREVWTNIDFPFTDNLQRVHNLCRIFTEDQRNGYTIKAEFSLKAWPRKVFERETFTSALFGHSAKIFRVTDKKYSPQGIVEQTIKEDAPSIWDFADAVVADDTPNTNLANPFIVNPLLNVVVESGTAVLLIQGDGTILSRMHVTWDQATSSAVVTNGLIEVEWFQADSLIANKVAVNGSETGVYLSPVKDGEYYDVRVRAVNPYQNVKSDWTYALQHQVIGKTEPPPNIQNFSIDGTMVTLDQVVAADLAGYRFKFHYGNNLDWGSANLLYNGIVTEIPFDLVTLPFGIVTIMAKAVDTSGNESLNSANIFINLGDPVIANAVFTTDFDPTYPGTYSNCSVVGGDVVANALDSFYGTDSQSFYGADADSFYEPGSYAQMNYITDELTIPVALAGSKATLNLSTLGVDVTVEYRLSSPGLFYGADAESFYGADADPFYEGAPGTWLTWPGQIDSAVDGYQFRVTIGAGPTQGQIQLMSLVVDAPDMNEVVSNVFIDAAGTIIPYLKSFTVITGVQATLQANASGAETVETDKTNPTAPVTKAYNSAHTSVSGASADFHLQGY
jgi:hypothetical protein